MNVIESILFIFFLIGFYLLYSIESYAFPASNEMAQKTTMNIQSYEEARKEVYYNLVEENILMATKLGRYEVSIAIPYYINKKSLIDNLKKMGYSTTLVENKFESIVTIQWGM